MVSGYGSVLVNEAISNTCKEKEILYVKLLLTIMIPTAKSIEIETDMRLQFQHVLT